MISWMSSPPAGLDAGAADDFSGLRVGEQLHETILGFHDEGFTVVVEGILGSKIRDVAHVSALFR